MDLLKKENWWVWLVIFILGSQFLSNLILGIFLKIYDKEAWYTKWQYWFIGIIAFVIPFFIMFVIFSIQIMVANALKLNVPGKEIYGTTYYWILGVIIPFIGWFALTILLLYLSIMIIVQLYSGEGEQYIEEK